MGKLKMAIYFGDKTNTGEYDNGVWMDILKIPFIGRIEEAANYDLVIRTLWIQQGLQGWSKTIRDRYPGVKQIGLSDHPLSTHISKMEPAQQIQYLADLQYLDGIMALTEEERQWYSIAVPNIAMNTHRSASCRVTRPVRSPTNRANSANSPPSPWLSACIRTNTYFTLTIRMSDQRNSERMPITLV